MSIQSAWIKSKKFDLLFLHAPIFLGLLIFLFPYQYFGPEIIFTLYAVRIFTTGVPHLFTTWTTLSTTFSKKNIRPLYVYSSIFIAAAFGAGTLFFFTPAQSSIFTAIVIFWGGWHSHKQHLGISKLYTHIQSQRWHDPSLLKDVEPLNWFLLLGLNTLFVYSFTRDQIVFRLSDSISLHLPYPKLPIICLYIYVIGVALVGIWALYRTVYQRSIVKKQRLPVPQIILTVSTVSVGMGMYAFLPLDGYWLVWIVPAVAHDIQYMAYAWLFETERAKLATTEHHKKTGISKWISNEKNWPVFLFPSYILTISVIALSFFGLKLEVLAVVHATTFFHYLVDGFIWKKGFNADVVPVTNLLVAQGSR